MRRAAFIAKSLLEASANGTTLRFGPGDSPYGSEYPSMVMALTDLGGEDGQRLDLEVALQKGYSFLSKFGPTDFRLYSLKNAVPSTEKAVDHISRVMGLNPDAEIGISRGPGINGQRQSLRQSFLEMPAEDKKEEVKKPAAGVENRLYFGLNVKNKAIDFPSANKEYAGADVVAVDAKSPAAKAGIEAGDIIVSLGPVITRKKAYDAPWRIRSKEDLEKGFRLLDGWHVVPITIIRKGYLVKLAVKPVRNKEEAPTLGNKVQPQAQAQVNFAPNPRDPVSMTGNQRANVSTLA